MSSSCCENSFVGHVVPLAAAQRIPYRRPQERWKRGNLDTAELAFVGLAFGRHRPALEAVSNDFLFHLPCSQRIIFVMETQTVESLVSKERFTGRPTMIP